MSNEFSKQIRESMKGLISKIDNSDLGYKVVTESNEYEYFTIQDSEGYQVSVQLGTPPLWVQTTAYKNFEDKNGRRPGIVLNEEECKIDVFKHDEIIEMIKEAFAYARVFKL